eukprot:1161152-Pelagomonas_calceolata.AAC.4
MSVPFCKALQSPCAFTTVHICRPREQWQCQMRAGSAVPNAACVSNAGGVSIVNSCRAKCGQCVKRKVLPSQMQTAAVSNAVGVELQGAGKLNTC